jgi:O-antigen ligase
MGYFAFAAVLVSMIFTILFPERMPNILYFRIPREFRPNMSADIHVPCVIYWCSAPSSSTMRTEIIRIGLCAIRRALYLNTALV